MLRRATWLPLLLIGACSSEPSAEPSPLDGATIDDAPGADGSSADGSSGDDTLPSDVAETDSGTVADAPTGSDAGPTVPAAHPRIYLNATQKARLKALVASGHPAAASFMSLATTSYEYQAWFSALKFQLAGAASDCTFAVSKVDGWVTAEEARIAAGARAEVAADSYLYVGDHIGDLALTLDWCWDTVTAAQRTRWLAYANQAVHNVWNPTTAKWGATTFTWSGWSINNPVNNYYYSFLRATLLLGLVEYTEDPRGVEWVKRFRETKIRDQLAPTFAKDLAGGGSREGTGYGVAMMHLFRLYDQWEQSTGERIADLTPHTRASLPFMLHQLLPTYDRVAPIGDHARDSTGALFDYHRDYANVLAWLYPSDPLSLRLRHVFNASTVPKMSQGFMRYSDFLYAQTTPPVAPDDVYPLYYGSGTGNVFMRSAWNKDATWAHFMCGPYTESHAHQDQGSFMVFKRGWLAYDQNINSKSGIVQSVRAHNLVRIDQGSTTITQRESAPMSSKLLALQDEQDWAYFAGDLSPAYEGRAAVAKVEREIVWLKPDVFVVFDRVRTTGSGISRVFQVNSPVAPTIAGRVATLSNAGSTLAVHAIHPAASTLRVVDWPMADSDMLRGARFESVDATGDTSYFLNVFSLDGGAVTAVAADLAGQRGVSIAVKGSGTAIVRFHEATAGATVEWKRADGSTITTGPRTMAIKALPLLK